MKTAGRKARHNDLFELFPDIPWPRRRSIDAQRARVLLMVAAARERAVENARKQLAASFRFRAMVAARRFRDSSIS